MTCSRSPQASPGLWVHSKLSQPLIAAFVVRASVIGALCGFFGSHGAGTPGFFSSAEGLGQTCCPHLHSVQGPQSPGENVPSIAFGFESGVRKPTDSVQNLAPCLLLDGPWDKNGFGTLKWLETNQKENIFDMGKL